MKYSPIKFKARAAKARVPVDQFAHANIHAKGEVGDMARAYYLAQNVHGAGKSNMRGGGDVRSPGSKLYQVG